MSCLNAKQIGELAEKEALSFLKKQGLQLIEKNFTTYNEQGKKTGEIDLIMQQDDYYVFVEVKTRADAAHGSVLEVVTRPKQNYIIKTATRYLQQNDLYDSVYCRFDVVGVEYQAKIPEIFWIQDAFQVQYGSSNGV